MRASLVIVEVIDVLVAVVEVVFVVVVGTFTRGNTLCSPIVPIIADE